MNSSATPEESNIVLKNKCITNTVTIVCCECFYQNWKEIRELQNDNCKFDEIENGKKCFRKLFFFLNKLFHCCHECFQAKISISSFQLGDEWKGYCISRKLLNEITDVSQTCEACILYFINVYSKNFKIL